ncbi:MAG: LD-carboxypeptidase [Cytophagaceae bacterium]|jgi:muramoyltetrapeptide carboxypeptidase|nr:LD-carboxypeptidase [Cytophagaceae bacterium]
MWVIPPRLEKGDQIAVVATAKVFNAEDVKAGMEVLKSWGLQVVPGKNLWKTDRYFAGTDAQRLSDLQTAIQNKNIKAILFARGGYGTSRIIDQVNFSALKTHPKWMIGFSDLTILHTELQRRGIASLHGNMCLQLANPAHALSVQALRETLAGIPYAHTLPSAAQQRVGKARGILAGGNLTLLVHGIGTASELDTSGKILFLEEIGESIYHIERMLIQWKRAGKFKKLAGLVLGQFTDIGDTQPAFGKSVEQVIRELVQEYSFPISFGVCSGHGSPNYPLVFGAPYVLQVQSSGASLLPDLIYSR